MTAQPTRDKVMKKLRKGPDLELHIKLTWIDGLEFVNIRNYVPSAGEYGKGVLFPSSMLESVHEELGRILDYNSTAGASPGAGQQSLAV